MGSMGTGPMRTGRENPLATCLAWPVLLKPAPTRPQTDQGATDPAQPGQAGEANEQDLAGAQEARGWQWPPGPELAGSRRQRRGPVVCPAASQDSAAPGRGAEAAHAARGELGAAPAAGHATHRWLCQGSPAHRVVSGTKPLCPQRPPLSPGAPPPDPHCALVCRHGPGGAGGRLDGVQGRTGQSHPGTGHVSPSTPGTPGPAQP